MNVDAIMALLPTLQGIRSELNPESLSLTVPHGESHYLFVLHTEPKAAQLRFKVEEGGSLCIVELFVAEAFADVVVEQEASSRLKLTALQLGSANASYRIDLKGRDAQSEVNGLFTVGEKEHSVLRIRTNHLVSDCRSKSLVRGVAGGNGVGEFDGMVYVAQDAQRTDAEQQNRNILLSEKARIDTKPQLEIYADDVKCSHGATVGQMDKEALFYMRQRGLDEQQARRLQLSGFVSELVMQCDEGCICDELLALLEAKLETL